MIDVIFQFKVDYIYGYVKFIDDGKVEVGGNLYEVDKILIVIGGYSVIFDILGAEYGIISDGFFDLEDFLK